MQKDNENPLDTLQDIRGIMERSARFLSLSGWSGVWAGTVALVASFIAYRMIGVANAILDFIVLGAVTFITAFIGTWLFTAQKAKKQGHNLWNKASRQLALQIAIPMLTGGCFIFAFIYYGNNSLVAPACLCFYGLALINGSKYTLTDIRYLGYMELILGGISMFAPSYGIYFLAVGFGILHIVYGIIMWNRYDRNIAR